MSKLLVVDDNPIYRRRLAELFVADGHEVETAGSADDAIEAGRRFMPEVLVVDRMLRSDMDGFDVAASLRKSQPHLKTIVITGYPSPSIDPKIDDPGIFAFFEKPFDPEELCDAVRRAASGQERS